MQAKITKTFINELAEKIKATPADRPYDINDTELKGFLARVHPSGIITYMVTFRWRGKRNRVKLGRHGILATAKARDKAKEILAGKELGIDPNEITQAKKTPLAQYTLKSFIDEKYQTWCEAHKKDGKATVKRLLKSFEDILDRPLADINLFIVEDWRTKRLLKGTRPATTNRDLNALKSLFTSAKEWGFVGNTLSGLKPLPIDSSAKIRFLNPDEETRLLNALAEREAQKIEERDNANKWRSVRGYPLFPQMADDLQPMVILSINTGIRWGELAQMDWADLDFDGATITVRGETAKTTKTRHIPINAKALKSLKTWKKVSGGEYGLIFPGEDGKRKDNANKAWSGLKERAKIINFRWHDLRHTFASKLVMAGVDLNTVRELLGHSDIKMTLRYAHLAPAHKAAAVALL